MPGPTNGPVLMSAADALDLHRAWSSVEAIGMSDLPMLAIDLRGLNRSFRMDDRDSELTRLLATVIQALVYGFVAITVSWEATVFCLVGSFFIVFVSQGLVRMSKAGSETRADTTIVSPARPPATTLAIAFPRCGAPRRGTGAERGSWRRS